MQYILLAAGRGHRLGLNLTNKCFAKICDKTLLDYNLELSASGLFDEIIVIVGYNAKFIKEYIGNKYNGIKITYVNQESLLGIAHAVKQAAPYIHTDFMMALSDEIHINPQVRKMANYFSATGADCVCGTVTDTPQNIKKAYTMNLNKDGNIIELVEKPDHCFNLYKGTGLCMMKPTMLRLLENLKPNAVRKEYEMGNWIQSGIEQGYICKTFQVSDANFNINEQIDMVEATTYFEHLKKEMRTTT